MTDSTEPPEHPLLTIERFFRMKATYKDLLDLDALILRRDLTNNEKTAQIASLVKGSQGAKQS